MVVTFAANLICLDPSAESKTTDLSRGYACESVLADANNSAGPVKSIPRREIVKETTEAFAKQRQIMADDLPDDLSVDLEILVNDPVPQSGDVRPFDSGSETGQLDRRAHDEAARYKARPVVSHQIDAFSPIIEARLQA